MSNNTDLLIGLRFSFLRYNGIKRNDIILKEGGRKYQSSIDRGLSMIKEQLPVELRKFFDDFCKKQKIFIFNQYVQDIPLLCSDVYKISNFFLNPAVSSRLSPKISNDVLKKYFLLFKWLYHLSSRFESLNKGDKVNISSVAKNGLIRIGNFNLLEVGKKESVADPTNFLLEIKSEISILSERYQTGETKDRSLKMARFPSDCKGCRSVEEIQENFKIISDALEKIALEIEDCFTLSGDEKQNYENLKKLHHQLGVVFLNSVG